MRALGAALLREIHRRLLRLAAYAWIVTHPRAAGHIRAERAWLLGGFVGRIYGDNCAALHQYLRAAHPELATYWVIDRDSPDVGRAMALGPVLFTNSVHTYVRSILAQVHAVSHGIHDIPAFTARWCRAFRVRLGHGITATRRRRPSSPRLERVNQRFDLIPVSSAFERANKLTWGVDADRIVITGVARFDTLLATQARTRPDPKRILYMPTWREQVDRTRGRPLEPDYANGVAELLCSTELHDVLTAHDAYMDVAFHVLARPFAAAIRTRTTSDRIRIVDDPDPQAVFAQVGALLTDYSSVTWDFLYIDKPVLFYQFDRAYLDTERGSHIAADAWPGPVAATAEEVVRNIGRYLSGELSRDTKLACVIREWQQRVFAYRDANNCERIAREILRRVRPHRAHAAGATDTDR